MRKTVSSLNPSDNLSRRLLSPIRSFIVRRSKRRARSLANSANWWAALALRIETGEFRLPRQVANLLTAFTCAAVGGATFVMFRQQWPDAAVFSGVVLGSLFAA